MTQRDISSFLPNLLGPLDFQVNGAKQSIPRREIINLQGDVQVADDPDNKRTNVAFVEGGLVLANATTGAQNNIASTDANGAKVSAIRFTGAAPTINGVESTVAAVAETRARRIVVVATGGPVIFAHENAGSTAANRIITSTGASVTLADESIAFLVYDPTSARWRLYPASGGTVPSGTGLRKVVAGVEDAAASLLLNADVNAAAAIAGSKIAPDFGAQDVTTTGALLVGTAPRAVTGDVRGPNGFVLKGRNPSNTADYSLLLNNSDLLFVGDTNSNGTIVQTASTGSVYLRLAANDHIEISSTISRFRIGATEKFQINANEIEHDVPIVGSSTLASPYGAHGGVAHTFAADLNYVVTAAQYKFDELEFITGSWTIGRTVTFPHPATRAVGYSKTIFNNTTFTMTVSTGTGTTRTLATGLAQQFKFDNGGVHFESPTYTP